MSKETTGLSAAKQALLRRRMLGAAPSAPDKFAIRPRAGSEPAPLSYAQQRLWVAHQLDPESPHYNEVLIRRITGALDVPALEAAVREIVRRHQVLRTVFAVVDGRAVQVVMDAPELRIALDDVSSLEPHERAAAARRVAHDEGQRPFDLATGPLIRVSLVRMAADEHVLVLAMHHVVTDGWAMSVLFRELSALYEAFSRGLPSPLAPLAVQYADFAAWQRGEAMEAQLREQAAWWKEQLRGAPAVLELPTDRPRPPAQSFKGARVETRLPGAVLEQLRALSRQEGATLFMTLLSAFQVLLHRYTGEDDLVIGTPVAGRGREELEGLIGFFVNTLALRADVSGDPSFRALLRRTRETVLDAYKRQDVPFDRVVEEVSPERTLSHTPIFQVMCVLQNAPRTTGAAAGLRMQAIGTQRNTAKFDLLLGFVEGEDELLAGLEYATDLYGAATAERMLAHLRRLLEGVAADPDRAVSELPILSPEERRQVVVDWNRTGADYPRAATLHELFAAQAARTPDAAALVCDGMTMTYRELDERSTRVARRLRALGVGMEDRVGLLAGRGVEAITALLGVLKAGAAYLPLDPGAPGGRLGFVLADAGARAVITVGDVPEAVPADVAVLRMDADAAAIDAESAEPVRSAAGPDTLAYLIYTSGSTGRPKGVLVEHGGACNLVTAQVRTFGAGAGDRILQFAPLHFDASVAEIFISLTTGATLYLAEREALLPGPGLVELLRANRITNAKFTPSALAAMPEAELPELRTVIVGGEPCPADVVARWAPGRRFFNVYGPTEATVRATVALCQPGEGRPPLGHALANTRLYVLDANFQPVPVGVPGELYIAGDGVARGYLNRPALTAERFVPDAFGGQGERLYRTGDRVRRLDDGGLEFLGRLDEQVKVRGYRVEPGEIEAALVEHPGVRDAVVMVREDAPGDRRLVAYVVPAEGTTSALGLVAADPRRPVEGRALHDIFAAQAARTPDAVALTCAGESLTYRQLDEKSNQIARFLQKRGVGPEVRVGLCMERSMEMVVSILGVLKAGGAYVPLDPFYPAERLAFQVEDSGIPVLLTQSSVRDVLPENGAETVCLDQDWDRIAAESADAVESGATPEALAYVIYTSGSTGKPKGVLVTHENAVRLFTATDEWFGFGADDVWTLFHSYAFDFSVWEIWGALLYGGKLVVVPFEVSRTPEAFYALLETEGVTVLNQTPSAFRQLMRVDEEAAARGEMRPLKLRNVVFGGEALDPASLRGWVARRGVDAPRLVNMYGITETTVHVTYRVITRDDVENGGGSPIGVAIPDLSVYVLDQKQQPVPVGVPGELYVGGAGVARGYHNRPELTAQRFIDSPFVDGERLYRSGDRVRWLADGGLEYLGRIDQQVKIRGFRIELGEIEAALQQHESVREAVVIAREDVPGDKRLVGYAVPADGGALSTAELRRHLLERLPDYMVPSAFVVLQELPLTRNGKVDKRALPAPDTSRPELEDAYVAPRSEAEQTLAAVWADVLRVERVGVEDNFFELGGDSILAIQVIARAQARGLRLTPKQIFQHQTVASLAAVAGTAVVAEAEQGVVTGAVELTPIQRWFFARELPNPHHYNQSMLVRLRERVEPVHVERAFGALMAHHDALRLRYRQADNGAWTQENAGISTEIPFDTVDLSALPEADRAAAIEAVCSEAQAGLDIIHGPILRAVLFELGDDEAQRLFIAIHHLAVDGVSWRILLEDLETAARQVARGESPALPAKTTSYRRWAERLARHAGSPELQAEEAYWTETEAGAAPLPRDLDGANTVQSARAVAMTLTEDETRALLQDVPAAYRTQINDVLLAALAQALTSWTGGTSAVIDLEGHGREELFDGVDLSRTVGWFTSIFPVRLDVPAEEGPGALLKGVKEQLRRIPNRGAGYGVLRAAAGTRPAELAFNYLGQFDGSTSVETLFAPAAERRGPENAGTGNRAHLIEVNGAVREGKLRLVWTFSGNVHQDETVRALVERYRDALRALIAHCTSADAGGFTPSDFPLARLTQAQLDEITAAGAVEDVYPLTPLQQGILFHSVIARAAERPYVIQLGWTLRDVDADALRAAWEGVVRRHTVLRTRFVWEGLDEPHQVVMREVRLPWVQEDWRHLPAGSHDDRLKDYMRAERARGLELDREPLMRFGMFRTGEAEWEFVWTHHHLISDGWSNPLMLREVFALYAAQTQGKTIELPRPKPYGEYVSWLAQQDLARAEAHWRKALAGFTAPTVPAMDRGAAAGGDEHADASLTLSTELSERLRALGRTRQITLNTVVQGAWALLLSRYAGQHDVAFGAVVSGRPATLPGVEGMLGMFINTLPVRVRVDERAPVGAWLAALQAEQAEARDFDFTPLMQAQAWSQVPRGTPLFDTLLVFENYPVDALKAEPGRRPVIDVRRVRSVERTTYPLTVMAVPRQELRLRVEYDTGRYDEAAVQRLLGHFAVILEAIATDPDQPVCALDPVTPAERAQLAAWNDTAVRYPALACVHHAIEAQADATPHAVALVFEGRTMTYAELDARATRLARTLRRMGVGPEVRVGLCLERSLEMVVAILGVLKAGGAYVPVDPSYPEDRIAFMLADSGVPVLLTQAQLEARLPEHGARVLRLDADWPMIETESADRFDSGATADTMAYMIYTSGSTGRPKGAMNAHRGIVNRLQWMQARYGLRADDVILQKTPFSFDVSVWEFLWPLMYGARMVVARPEGHRHPAYLAETIEAQGVTTMHFVPSMLQLFLDEAELDRCASLRRVVCSGEALPAALAARFHERMPAGVELHNLYGPTEAAVDVTEWECRPDSRESAVPIGIPVANTQIHLLDPSFVAVPVGVAGELYIAGVQVGRGYLGRPGLTAEKFVPDPFSPVPGARMYRTGDLARRREDGAVEYLGRTDFQVKLRGLRIELGEIESALLRHPEIRETVVIAREDVPGEQRLAAYIVPTAGAALPDVQALRASLAARLPDYMVPSHFVAMDALPLSPNGKVERRALPAPERPVRDANAAFAAPETADQAALAELWTQVLGVERVGIDENFFDLGGDSLKAMRLVEKARRALGREVPLGSVLAGGTIRAMAAALDRGSAPDQPLVTLQAGTGTAPLFCVHPDGPGHVGCYIALARALGADVPVYGLQDPGCASGRYRDLTLEERAAWYLEGVRAVQPHGPYHLFGWSFGGSAAFEMARQLREAGEEVALVAMADTLSPALFLDFFREPSPGRTFSNALFAYDARPCDVPVVLYRAAELDIWRDERQAVLAASEAFGWDALAPVEVETMPGNHNDMTAEPNVHALAAALRPRLGGAA